MFNLDVVSSISLGFRTHGLQQPREVVINFPPDVAWVRGFWKDWRRGGLMVISAPLIMFLDVPTKT